jgi:CubicO group peptidase (beta-lactamase class C family)
MHAFFAAAAPLYRVEEDFMAVGKSEHMRASASEVVTAAVVDGVRTGSLGDPAVPWWSFTKTLLAAAALVLVDSGRLALDAPLAGRRSTLRQLLQHRAGIPDYCALAVYHAAVARGDHPWPVAELLERVSVLRTFEPGTVWLYSNVGYLFVRQSIEEATGEHFGAALARLVLDPLGVAGARLAATPDDLNETRWGNARGYHPGWVYHGLLTGPPAAAALALDRLLRGDLLSAAALRAMQDAVPLDVPVAGRPWHAPGYGLGLMIERSDAGPLFLGHSGQGPSSTAAVYHFPARRPLVTASAFAPTDNEALVEHRAVDIARSLQS